MATPDRRLTIQVLVIITLCFVNYVSIFWNGFAFDDAEQIVSNPWIKKISFIPDIFSNNVWAFNGSTSNYYRPLMHVIYMACFQVFGMKPWGYHLVSLLFHAGTSILVYLTAAAIIREEEKSLWTAPFVAACLFAVHPIHTEAVAWAGSIPDLTYTFFCMMSLMLYIKSKNHPAAAALYWASAATFFISLFCKEPALTFPAIIIAYDLLLDNKTEKKTLLKRYVPFVAAIPVYLTVRYAALGGFVPEKSNPDFGLGGLIAGIPVVLSKYMCRLLFPFNYRIDEPIPPVTVSTTLFSLAVAAIFVLLLAAAFKKRKQVFFFMLLMVIPLLPSLYLPGVSWNSFFERSLYFPSFGFLAAVSFSSEWMYSKRTSYSRFLSVCLVAAIVVCSINTISRNGKWKDDVTLFSDAHDQSLAHASLGTKLLTDGRVDDAVANFKAAIAIRENFTQAHFSLAQAYDQKKLYEEAIKEYKIVLDEDPRFPLANRALGKDYGMIGLIPEAIAELEKAVELNSYDSTGYNDLGVAYGLVGRTDKAIEQFRKALELDPDDMEARENLDYALKIQDNTVETGGVR